MNTYRDSTKYLSKEDHFLKFNYLCRDFGNDDIQTNINFIKQKVIIFELELKIVKRTCQYHEVDIIDMNFKVR